MARTSSCSSSTLLLAFLVASSVVHQAAGSSKFDDLAIWDRHGSSSGGGSGWDAAAGTTSGSGGGGGSKQHAAAAPPAPSPAPEPAPAAATLDAPRSATGRRVPTDDELQWLLRRSVAWLTAHAAAAAHAAAPSAAAADSSAPLLAAYAGQLRALLRPCARCVDYFEAVGLLRALSRSVALILDDGRPAGLHVPVVRRSFVAAAWLLQRSRLYRWQAGGLPATALATMFRLYEHHAERRARGRPISLHHVSKCGGTTMCRLAAHHRCSNPHMDTEKNCVLDDKLDGPVWMIAHNVSAEGPLLNPALATLDAAATPADVRAARLAQQRRRADGGGSPSSASSLYATEPPLDMWLMYTCPYAPAGRPYTCRARVQDARSGGATFFSNERTLLRVRDSAQPCAALLNAVILRAPVGLAVSLMAEARYRYVRQLAFKHRIRSWQPPTWNLTWWETLAPALVGSYATRTLLGRDALCRSAGRVGARDADEAAGALLAFDAVMALDRPADVDAAVAGLLGWRGRSFSAEPAQRVRRGAGAAFAGGATTTGDGGGGGSSGGRRRAATRAAEPAAAAGAVFRRALLARAMPPPQSSATRGGSANNAPPSSSGGATAAAAEALVRSLWRERFLELLLQQEEQEEQEEQERRLANDNDNGDGDDDDGGGSSSSSTTTTTTTTTTATTDYEALIAAAADPSALAAVADPHPTDDGAHVVRVSVPARLARVPAAQGADVWHAFPRHGFAFVEDDVRRLRAHTAADGDLYRAANVLLTVDVAWLAALSAPGGGGGYARRVRALAPAGTACGFAGLLPEGDGDEAGIAE